MGRYQMLIIGLCFGINMLDGLDILVIAFTAPAIAAEWGLRPDQLGILFSSGLAGMVLGSLFIAPIADVIGRRKMLLSCMVVISVGMIGAALTANVTQLMLMRLLTGLGVGAMLPSLNTQVAEYASSRRRSFAISLMQIGFVIGGMLGGILATYMVVAFGWRSMFMSAGIASLVLIPVVYVVLPESLDYLVSHQPRNALAQANRILARLGQPQVDALPPPPQGADKPAGGLAAIVAPEYRVRSFLIWACFFIAMFVLYFVLNWTPQALVAAGMPVTQGIGAGVILNVGGIAGSLLLGYVATYFGLRRLVAVYMGLTVVTMVAFGFIGTELLPMLVVGFMVGFFIFGVMIGLYAVVPNLYPSEIRTTGTGWAIGIGRLGAVAGPYVAGLLIAAGWERELYYSLLALPLLLGVVAVLNVGRNQDWS